jgi:hypothetical protein
VNLFTGLGQINLLAELFGQSEARLLLQLPDLHRDRRLRQVQLLRGTSVAQVLRNRRKTLQLT